MDFSTSTEENETNAACPPVEVASTPEPSNNEEVHEDIPVLDPIEEARAEAERQETYDIMIRILEAARTGGRPALDRGETKFQVCDGSAYSLVTVSTLFG